MVTLEQVRSVLAEKKAMTGRPKRSGTAAEVRRSKLSAVDPKHYPALLKDAEVI